MVADDKAGAIVVDIPRRREATGVIGHARHVGLSRGSVHRHTGDQRGDRLPASAAHRLRQLSQRPEWRLLMTRQDAQLLYDWRVRRYGDPTKENPAPRQRLS